MKGPTLVLLEAFMERLRPTIEQLRAEGWPVVGEVVKTNDGRTVALVAVEIETPSPAEGRSVLPLVPEPGSYEVTQADGASATGDAGARPERER
jgi:hypothetical protein